MFVFFFCCPSRDDIHNSIKLASRGFTQAFITCTGQNVTNNQWRVSLLIACSFLQPIINIQQFDSAPTIEHTLLLSVNLLNETVFLQHFEHNINTGVTFAGGRVSVQCATKGNGIERFTPTMVHGWAAQAVDLKPDEVYIYLLFYAFCLLTCCW
jgi:hypothetical protein